MPNCAYLTDKEVLFTGWMVKAPPEHKMKRRTGLAKVITYMNCTSPRLSSEEPCRSYYTKWHRRFFVLFKPKGGLPNEYLLEYFTDENCSRKKGAVDLDNCSEIAAFDQTLPECKMEFVLSLKTLSRNKNRVYFMSCESEEMMNEWVRNLIFACNLVARNDEDYPSDYPDYPPMFPNYTGYPSQSSSIPPTPATRTDRSNTTSASSGNLLGGPNGVAAPPAPRPRFNSTSADGNFARGSNASSSLQRGLNSVYNKPADVYHVPPNLDGDVPGREMPYYNMRGADFDSVYQMPPEIILQSAEEQPPRAPPQQATPLSHEYINLASVGRDEEDVYKIPLDGAAAAPPVPPPPLPKRSLRASFVRKGANANRPPQPQPRAPLPSQAPVRTAAPPPPPAPASPGSDAQHEYLNLWAGGEESGPGPGGFTSAPRSINDVPPLRPARPPRLRNRDTGHHTSSCSNSSSSSSSNSSSNSSASPPVIGSGVTPPYDFAGERRPSAPSPPNRVSYMCADDLIFSNEVIPPAIPRSSSFTEYNELDPVRTCAVAKVAEGLKKNTN